MTETERKLSKGKPVGVRFAQETASEILALLEERTSIDKRWHELHDSKVGQPIAVKREIRAKQQVLTERDEEVVDRLTQLGFTYGGTGCSQEALKADAADPVIQPGEKRFAGWIEIAH